MHWNSVVGRVYSLSDSSTAIRTRMDCATFYRQHTAFVDGAINDVELASMQRHIAECASCAARDVAVRRALVVFRSLPDRSVAGFYGPAARTTLAREI